MKTKAKITSIIAALLCVVSLLSLIGAVGYNNESTVAEAKVRTFELVDYHLDDQSLFDEFDEHTLQTDEVGFEITAKKNFDTSIFSEIDFVDFDCTQEMVTVRYDVQYIENDDAILLTVTIEGENDIPLVETIPGLVSHNILGEPDVMFVADGEYLWLSELKDSELINEVGWLSSLIRKVVKKASDVATNIANAVVSILKPVIRLGNNIAVRLLGRGAADIGAAVLNMTPELDAYGKPNGIYHADFDCWQQHFGYIDLYDTVFNAATSMRSAKFPFTVIKNNIKTDYILWAWKGDYLNLGAGAELGIYTRWRFGYDIWKVDKSLAMAMTLKLDYKGKTIIDWQSDSHWWITGFNYNYQNVNRNDLYATFSVTFNNPDMNKAFNNENKNSGYGWIANGGYKYTYSF